MIQTVVVVSLHVPLYPPASYPARACLQPTEGLSTRRLCTSVFGL